MVLILERWHYCKESTALVSGSDIYIFDESIITGSLNKESIKVLSYEEESTKKVESDEGTYITIESRDEESFKLTFIES